MRKTLFTIALLTSSLPLSAQTRESGPWWPSQWGLDDQAGASNYITPDKILSAVGLVETGQVYELGQVYEAGMPLYPGRSYSLLTQSLGAPLGENRAVGYDDFVATQIGQVGTQFDGLGHIGTVVEMEDGTTEAVFYNGNLASEFYTPTGLTRLGIEQVKPIITRGVLIDVAAYREMDVLPAGYEITVEDMEGALARQGMSGNDIGTGDAVLIRTGWSTHWTDSETYNAGAPGMGVAVARWLVERQITVTGGDTWANEVNPNPSSDLMIPAHQELMNRSGTFNIENMVFEELAADGVYEFLFIATPLRFRGGTGSPLRPIAIR